ncbi:MAG: EamA family transporter [Deltaproteobacteria bacterium]|nr:EamA family transporter [Deltaproteobacteria bacterium]
MNQGTLFIVYSKLLLTAVFWGGTFVAGRIIAGRVGPFSAAFLRFVCASACLLYLVYSSEKKFPLVQKSHLLPLILLGLTGVFTYNILFFKGLQYINAGRASLIIANNPVFITLFAAILFKERLTFLRVMGIAFSVFGAIIVVTRGNLTGIVQEGVGWGEILIFGCVASWVAYSLIGKVVMSGKRLSPLISVTYSSLIGALALFPMACIEGVFRNVSSYSVADWGSLVYLGVFGTVLGFVWYYEGINAIGPMKAGQFINFVPISAVLLAFLILQEPITLSLLIGGVFVIGGVILTNVKL